MKLKPIIVLIVFVGVIAMFAGGMIGTTDLTPDTPPADGNNTLFNAGAAPNPANPSNSPCISPYTIRQGDTLSRIGQACGLRVNDLLAANPGILNPNMISPGQQIQIPALNAPTAVLPAATTAPVNLLPANQAPAPVTGLRPGGTLHTTIKGLPPSTPVKISIGKIGGNPLLIDEAITGADGQLVLHVAIPTSAKPGEMWFISAVTTGSTRIQVTSAPFEIEK